MKTENQTFANKFVSQSIEKAAWKKLSESHSIAWSKELISYHIDEWDWDVLSENDSINWSAEMLDRFEHYLNWSKVTDAALCSSGWQCVDIKNWSREDLIAYIDKFIDKWDWEIISEDIDLPQIEFLLDRFPSKISWSKLANNRNIEWTFEMFAKYEEYLCSVDDIEDTKLWEALSEKKAGELLSKIRTSALSENKAGVLLSKFRIS